MISLKIYTYIDQESSHLIQNQKKLTYAVKMTRIFQILRSFTIMAWFEKIKKQMELQYQVRLTMK